MNSGVHCSKAYTDRKQKMHHGLAGLLKQTGILRTCKEMKSCRINLPTLCQNHMNLIDMTFSHKKCKWYLYAKNATLSICLVYTSEMKCERKFLINLTASSNMQKSRMGVQDLLCYRARHKSGGLLWDFRNKILISFGILTLVDCFLPLLKPMRVGFLQLMAHTFMNPTLIDSYPRHYFKCESFQLLMTYSNSRNQQIKSARESTETSSMFWNLDLWIACIEEMST